MTQVPTIDITRFRLNSQSSMDNYSSMDRDRQSSSMDKSKKEIPLILKKMNSVEKYINEFRATEVIQKKSRPKRSESPLYDPTLSTSKHLEKIYEKTPERPLRQDKLKELDEKCYVKYSSTSAHDSGSKNFALDRVQNQYVRLKHSIHTTGLANTPTQTPPQSRTQYISSEQAKSIDVQNHSLKKAPSFVNSKSIYLLNRRKAKQRQSELQTHRINHDDVQKQLKTSVIEEGGKKYFADLYLMKRQRDKMLKEIFGAGQKKPANAQNNSMDTGENYLQRNSSYRSKVTQKSQNSKQSLKRFPKLKVNITQVPYEQKMLSQQQNFVQQKILKDRSQKKQKMLKGRNMNWNVYYEMLALKKNEKDKLKEYCKFSQTYADD